MDSSLDSILYTIYIILQGYGSIMALGIFLSWIPSAMNLKFFRMVHHVGDWYMGNFTGIIVLGGLDLSPIIGFFVYETLVNAFLWI